MSKNLIILSISIVVAISISIGVYISVKPDQVVIEKPTTPDWKALEAQEKKIGVNMDPNTLKTPY